VTDHAPLKQLSAVAIGRLHRPKKKFAEIAMAMSGKEGVLPVPIRIINRPLPTLPA
jgi:hypothetical protein